MGCVHVFVHACAGSRPEVAADAIASAPLLASPEAAEGADGVFW